MAVSGLPQMKNHTSVETLEITQNLLNSPKQCPCGHGLMVLLRVPCSPLAAVAYERLAHVRARLALEEHFEIILGNPSSGITVGKHFVKQLKVSAVLRSSRFCVQGCKVRRMPRSFQWGTLAGWQQALEGGQCDISICSHLSPSSAVSLPFTSLPTPLESPVFP
jgi:hypothetical protein